MRTSRNNWLHFHLSSTLISLRKRRGHFRSGHFWSLWQCRRIRDQVFAAVSIDESMGRGRMSVIWLCTSLWIFNFLLNWYTFIRLFVPNYLRFILLYIFNNVYYINLTIFQLRKTSFPIKEILELVMLHARSRKLLLQNPQLSTVVECQPARSCQYMRVDSELE
jgi:hypothetical protein